MRPFYTAKTIPGIKNREKITSISVGFVGGHSPPGGYGIRPYGIAFCRGAFYMRPFYTAKTIPGIKNRVKITSIPVGFVCGHSPPGGYRIRPYGIAFCRGAFYMRPLYTAK